MKTRELTVFHFYFSDAGDRQRIRLGGRCAITPPPARNCWKISQISGMKENIPNTNINIIIVFSTEGQLFVKCNFVTNDIVFEVIV